MKEDVFAHKDDAASSGAVRPQAANSGWRPWISVPHDGRVVMAWGNRYEWPELVRWELYDATAAAEIGVPGYWRFADGLFADVAEVAEEEFTHWAPVIPPDGEAVVPRPHPAGESASASEPPPPMKEARP